MVEGQDIGRAREVHVERQDHWGRLRKLIDQLEPHTDLHLNHSAGQWPRAGNTGTRNYQRFLSKGDLTLARVSQCPAPSPVTSSAHVICPPSVVLIANSSSSAILHSAGRV